VDPAADEKDSNTEIGTETVERGPPESGRIPKWAGGRLEGFN